MGAECGGRATPAEMQSGILLSGIFHLIHNIHKFQPTKPVTYNAGIRNVDHKPFQESKLLTIKTASSGFMGA